MPLVGLGLVSQPCASCRLERLDLVAELVRGGALEPDDLPVDRLVGIGQRQRRRVRVAEVGDHEHRVAVLVEAVRHLLQAQAHILEADLLRDREHRHRREQLMGRAHHSREDGRVAHPGIEEPQRRRRRVQLRQLERRALDHDRLLVAGVDEGQVLLAVVVEAKRRSGTPRGRRSPEQRRQGRRWAHDVRRWGPARLVRPKAAAEANCAPSTSA